MKLRNIIKSVLKEQQIFKSNLPTFSSSTMHVYRGCNLGAPNTGVGNTAGNPPYDGFIPNQMTGGNYSDPNLQESPPATLDDMLINNSTIIHGYWNNPSQGQVIKVVTCNPNSQQCNPTCLEYLGTETSFSNGNYQSFAYGGNSNLTQHLGTYASCGDCDNGTAIVSGCTNPSAVNYDANATQDDGSCVFGYNCVPVFPGKPLLGKNCKPGNQNNPGQFETLQDCRNSGCGPAFIDKYKKYNPSSIQAKKIDREPIDGDAEKKRMIKLANISKK